MNNGKESGTVCRLAVLTVRTVVVAVLTGLALAAAPAAHAQEPARTIRVTDAGVQSIGSFKTTGSGRRPWGTLAQAITAFGTPTSRRYIRGRSACLVRWSDLGLRIEFDNFGANKGTCKPRYGLAQTAHISGAGWTTERGLAIGAPVDQIVALYPEAEQQPDGTWWLIIGLTPFGQCDDSAGCPYGIISATAESGFVTALDIPIGAAGE